MNYILAFLFIGAFFGALIFAYLQAKLFVGTIKSLVKVISELKSFSMGVPKEGPSIGHFPAEPSDPDFGYGKVLTELDEAENEEGEI